MFCFSVIYIVKCASSSFLCFTGRMLMTSQDPESAVIWALSPLTSQLISLKILLIEMNCAVVYNIWQKRKEILFSVSSVCRSACLCVLL